MRHHFETVFMYLYDVGRSVDLERSRRLVPSSRDQTAPRSRDTPSSLSVPAPLQIEVATLTSPEGTPFENLRLYAKVYEDGVVSMIARAELNIDLDRVHTVRGIEFATGDAGRTNISGWARFHYESLTKRIAPAITLADYPLDAAQRETYAAICLLDPPGDIDGFVDENAQYLATLLLGENPSIQLHQSQVKTTLDHRFAFSDNDLTILDLDRCLIIDPDRDYEDILLICELANYQLVELRTLDRLLDRWLDSAESDIRNVYLRRSHRARFLSRKIGNLIPLRLDALFILENLENTSKIIGDYYLGQVYQHLCDLMGTAGWERSVRRRLEALQEIYSMAKVDVNERLVLIMEILVVLLIAFEIVALLFPLLPHG